MARDTLQIRIVTGEGLLRDLDFGLYADLTKKEVAEAAKRFKLAAVGTLLDFVHPELLWMMLENESVAGVVLGELIPCWEGRPLAPGTAYGVLLGEERLKSFAERNVLARIQEAMAGDRFRDAGQGGTPAGLLEQVEPSAEAKVQKAPRGRLPASVQARLKQQASGGSKRAKRKGKAS
jgi:hypothetical protein